MPGSRRLAPSPGRWLSACGRNAPGVSTPPRSSGKLGNFARLVRLVSEIRATGCGIGLDDFGSGLTSFAHLKALPVDYVKIGGHYVRGVVDDLVYSTLISLVNQIGRIMGITTIAQEVESEIILEQLRVLGVEYAQGHAVVPPVPLVDADGEVALPCVQLSA
jgi:EAL domain-containing protein (putative c-di-GMP-specific phosphodiesterase class I)